MTEPAKRTATKVDFKLDALYLHARLLSELAGDEPVSRAMRLIPHTPFLNDTLVQHVRYGACGRILREWLIANWEKIEPLETMLLRKTVAVRRIFTTQRDFYCRNLTPRIRPTKAPPQLRAKYDLPDKTISLVLRAHRDHLAPGSAGQWLTGHRSDLFIVGMIKEVKKTTILASPIFIGYMLEPSSDVVAVPAWRPEIHVSEIECFAACAGQEPVREYELKKLLRIPEQEIKKVIADLIGEDHVPKDWSGETSDLSATVAVKGQSVQAAFLFKGPAKFHPMTMRDLGSNGDQIDRLFREPADLIILQHCHRIHAGVRNTMRAYANRVGDQRNMCIIDGRDTLRILRAYGKCGQKSKPKRPRRMPEGEVDTEDPFDEEK